ncbi:MAG: hypothetical protein RJA36_3378 [Pseudomonadota bacterium]|jgi:PAS domain S-box-containing protein
MLGSAVPVLPDASPAAVRSMPTKTPDFPPPPTRSRLVATPWAVLTLAFLGAAAGLGYDLYAEQRSIVENERHRLAHQSEVVQVSLSRQIQVTSNALDTMRSALPAMLAQQDGSRLANRYLQTMAPGMTGVRKLVLVAPGGKVIAGSQPELTGRDYRDSERYRTMRDRGDPNLLYISEPFTTLAGTVTIALGKIVLDDRGRVAAYLIAGMDPEYFITMLKSMLYASDMRVLLIHGDGKAILRLPEPAGIPGMDFATMPESFTARHLDSGLDSSLMSGMAASTGEHLLAALRTVRPESIRSDKTLIVLLGRRTDAMFERWRQDLALHVSLFALVALSSFLGLWLYQRRQFALEQTLAAEEAARARAEKSLRTQEAEHSRTEEKLRNSEARFHRLFEDMRQAVVLLEDGRCIAANRAALAMLRVDQADKLVGKTPMDISPPFQPDGRASAEKAAEMIWIASELGSNVFEWEHVRANGEPFMTRVLVSLIRQSDKDLHHVVLYDITQEQLARQELELLAFHDTLTGLPNRLLGREQLRRAIAAAARDNSRAAHQPVPAQGRQRRLRRDHGRPPARQRRHAPTRPAARRGPPVPPLGRRLHAGLYPDAVLPAAQRTLRRDPGTLRRPLRHCRPAARRAAGTGRGLLPQGRHRRRHARAQRRHGTAPGQEGRAGQLLLLRAGHEHRPGALRPAARRPAPGDRAR